MGCYPRRGYLVLPGSFCPSVEPCPFMPRLSVLGELVGIAHGKSPRLAHHGEVWYRSSGVSLCIETVLVMTLHGWLLLLFFLCMLCLP